MTTVTSTSRWYLLPVVLAAALFVALAVRQADAPLHLDNMDFPAAAEATSQTGMPVYYRGEWNSEHSSLYHPPLYVYTLALWFKVFGAGAAQARLFGALCALLLCAAAVALSRRLLGERSRRIDWALWPLFLLQAFTLQASAILDIDTSVYGPLLVLLLVAAVAVGTPTEQRLRWVELVPLVVLVALCLWSKMTTVLAFLAVLPLLLLPRLRFWRAVAVSAVVVVGGIALFLLTYIAFGRLLQVDVTYSFQFLVDSFFRGGHRPAYRYNALVMVPFTLCWTGLLPWLVAPLVALRVLWNRFELDRRQRWQVLVVLALGLGGTAYYLAQTTTFGRAPNKYVFPLWPLVLLPAAWLVGEAVDALRQWSPRARWGAAATLVGGLAVAFVLGRWVSKDSFLITMWAPKMLWIPALVGAAAIAAWWFGSGAVRALAPAVWLAAVVGQVGFQSGVAAFQAQAEHSTSYDYGQLGLAETIEYVRAHTAPGEVIVSMKDVGYQADRPYFENYIALHHAPSLELVKQGCADGTVKLLVFTVGIGLDGIDDPAFGEWMATHTDPVARFGHYRLYRPRPAAASTP